MNKKAVGLLLVIVLLVSSCGLSRDSRDNSQESDLNEPTEEYIEIEEKFVLPQEIYNLIEENRRLSFPSHAPNFDEHLQEFLTTFDSQNSERDAEIAAFILDNPRRWAEGFLPPAELTHQEILEEIDFLFDLLRYGYAAYQYVGGDEAFNNLRELMTLSLSSMSDPLDINSYVYNLLKPYLMTLIFDNHVLIWNESLGVESRFYINDELTVNLIYDSYFVEINGQLYRVLDSDNVFPTLTPNGEFAWAFGYLSFNHRDFNTQRQPIEKTIRLENVENEIITHTIELSPIFNYVHNTPSEDFVITYEVDGIPVLRNRTFIHTDTQHQVFLNSSISLRNEPVIIIDLRGNWGGSDSATSPWVRNFTGVNPNSNLFTAHMQLDTLTTNVFSRGFLVNLPYPRWRILVDSQPTSTIPIPNDTLVIVLTDGAISSATETFIGKLRQMDNVLVVGTNTHGSLLTTAMQAVNLPASGVSVWFGTSLNLRPDFSQFEGIGFMPDLWVDPQDSLGRVLRFIENS